MSSQINVVLLVGLIGSGKSSIQRTFATMNVGVIESDTLAKEMIYKESNREHLTKIFGEDVLFAKGMPNKERIRELLFQRGKAFYKEIQSLIMSQFRAEILTEHHAQIGRYRDGGKQLVVIEHALALRDEWARQFSSRCVISLHCPSSVRLGRLVKRDSRIPVTVYQSIMAAQPNDNEHMRMSEVAGTIQVDTNCTPKVMQKKIMTLRDIVLS